ncbi:hypothetical protein LCGC14_2919810, partial [marine sediment metagenome]
GNVLSTNGSGILCWTAGGAGALGGSGTAGTIAKWSAAATLTDSIMTESGAALTVAGTISLSGIFVKFTSTGTINNLVTSETNTGTGSLRIQAGGGSATYGGGITLYANQHATKPGDVFLGISSGSGGSFRFGNTGVDSGSDVFTISSVGDTVISGTLTSLNMGGNIDLITNNITAGGRADFTIVTASTGVYRAGVTNSTLQLSGGSTRDLGGNIILYGESHGSKAFDLEFRASTTVRLEWDNSELKFTVTGKLTITDLVQTKASHSGAGSPFRIPHGVAPTSLTNGDIWTTTAGLFVYVNGGTVGPLT